MDTSNRVIRYGLKQAFRYIVMWTLFNGHLHPNTGNNDIIPVRMEVAKCHIIHLSSEPK